MTDSLIDLGLAEPYLSPREKELRDKFIVEYFKDFNGKNAAIRCGYQECFAGEYAIRLLDETYVRRGIEDHKIRLAENPKMEDEETKRTIRALLLKEANYHGLGSSHSARVAALAKLSIMYGMDAPIKTEIDVKHRGGVMAVPGIASMEDWEGSAISSQEALVRDAKLN